MMVPGNGFVARRRPVANPVQGLMGGCQEQSCHSIGKADWQVPEALMAGSENMGQGSGALICTCRLQLQMRLVRPLMTN